MKKLHRYLVAGLALPVLVGGCSAATTASGPASVVASAPAAPATSAVAATSKAAPSAAAPATGTCKTIDLAAATALLGGTPKQVAAPAMGESGGIVKLDGCSYTGTDPSLGYDVLRYTGKAATEYINAAKAEAASEDGVTPFDEPLGDAAFAFTVPLGPKTMARVTVAKGDVSIAVVVTASSPDKAKATALAATAKLFEAWGH